MKKDQASQKPGAGFGHSLPSKVVSCVASAALATMMVPAVAVTAFADETQQGVQQNDAIDNIVSEGVIPSSKGESETVHYGLADDGEGKYTLTFWDSTGSGVIPDYVAPSEAKENWQNYEIQPWRKDVVNNTSFQSNITKVVFDKSIKRLGNLCVANLSNCADYYVMGENVESSSRPLYFYSTDYMQHDVTIHRYAAAAANHLFGSGVAKEQQELFDRDMLKIDYLDARDFENTYNASVFSANDPSQSDVTGALSAFKALPAAVRKQLDVDIVPSSSGKTYMAVLNELAEKNGLEKVDTLDVVDSGQVTNAAASVKYKITDDGSGNYTLTFWDDGSSNGTEGVGVIPDYTSDAESSTSYMNLPWRTGTYASKITKVVFEESIRHLGEICVANMPKVTDYYIMNGNPSLGSEHRPIYFNLDSDAPAGGATIHRSSTVSECWNFGSDAKGKGTSKRINTSWLEAEDFESRYESAVFKAASVEVSALQTALTEFKTLPGKVRKQLDTDIVPETTETYMAALNRLAATNGIEERVDAFEVVKEGFVPSGKNGNSETIKYKVLDEDNNGYTLTFWDSDSNGDGKIPDYTAHSSYGGQWDEWSKTPWRVDGVDPSKITKVIFDKSITYLGELCAANLMNCTDYYVMNDQASSARRPLYFVNKSYLHQKITIHHSSSVEIKESKGYQFGGSGDQAPTVEQKALITHSYLEAENFQDTYNASVFEANSPAKADLENALKDFANYSAEVRRQLAATDIPDGSVSYMDRLNELAKANGLAEVDANEEVETGQVNNAATSVQYKITDDGTGNYTLTFWDSDPKGSGVIPDYVSDPKANNSYVNLPWRVGTNAKRITKVVFEKSIKRLGEICVANMPNVTDFYIMNPSAAISNRPIYFNSDSDAATTGVTIHRCTSIDDKCYSFGNSATEETKNRVKTSWLEAEDFESNHEGIWNIDYTDNAAVQASKSAIEGAHAAFASLPDKAKTQLTIDRVPGSEDTYATRLNKLMAALSLGGTIGEVSWALSQNADGDTYTLSLSGSGNVAGGLANALSANAEKVTAVNVGNGIVGIESDAFSYLANLKSIDIPQSVTTIADGSLPSSNFTMYGWLNHASGKYAEAHKNVQLKLKELRVLCMGNSHTVDYTEFLGNVIKDQNSGTKVTFERLVSGGRGLYTESGVRSSHYCVAHGTNGSDTTDKNRDAYDKAFTKTWDIVIMQDYQESTKGLSGFASNMQKVVKWLRAGDDKSAGAKGAKLVWFADWAPNYSGNSYENSINSIEAVNALTSDKPDYIIPASTILSNASSSYLGKVKNADDVICGNKKENEEGYYFGDCFADHMNDTQSILWRDDTHMSLELGRQMMATGVLRHLYNYIGGMMQDDGFGYDKQNTDPVFTTNNGAAYWQGEMNGDLRNVINEAVENSITTPLAKTSSSYTADPFTAKYNSLRDILERVTLPVELSSKSLKTAFTSDNVLQKINNIGFSNIVTADDVTVSYSASTEIVGGTGKLEVKVNCHYGYTFPAESDIALTKNIAINTCTVNFDGNGATNGQMAAQIVNKNGNTVKLSANKFSRAGYTFTGWNTAADGTGTTFADGDAVRFNENTTLYAQWKYIVSSSSRPSNPDPTPTPKPTPAAPSVGDTVTSGEGAAAATFKVTAVAEASGIGGEVEYTGPVSAAGASNATVPEGVNINGVTYVVTSIAPEAFKGATDLVSIEIPATVVKIGASAFEGCTKLAAVKLPVGVKTIEARTFKGCVALKSVTTKAARIEASAFAGCTALVKLKAPNVKVISKNAFKGAKSLKSLTTGASLTTIGASAFSGNKHLTSITVLSKHLSKASVKGSLKGSAIKSVTVRVGTVKANKAYAKKYAKLFTKKIAGKKATVTASKKPLKK